MKAIIQEKYGPSETLKLINVKDLNHPKSNELKIAMHYINLTAGDLHINTMDLDGAMKVLMKIIFGFKKPRHPIRGITGSGIITAIGPDVKSFKVGDAVCFVNSMKAGALADEILIKETGTVAKVDTKWLKEASTLPFGFLSATHFINSSTVKKDAKVLILGASGSVGMAAVSIANHLGAEVTSVARIKNKQATEKVGSTHFIDYQSKAFKTPQKDFDIVFDAVNKYSKKEAQNWLKEGGKYYSIKNPTKESKSRLLELVIDLQNDSIQTYIERIYPLSEYRKAHDHLYNGHKVGNILIQWSESHSNKP